VQEEPPQQVLGTAKYAAPEILLGKPADHKKIDIWACACVLYTITEYQYPFPEITNSHGVGHPGTCRVIADCRFTKHHAPTAVIL
jgi:serine/threonine protein kinase